MLFLQFKNTKYNYKILGLLKLFLFSKKMKIGGIITGHDYTLGNWVSTYRYGVIEAVHEFCMKFDWEIILLTIDPLENQSFAIRKI